MKTIRFTFIFTIAAVVLTSCDWFNPVIPPNSKQYYYFLHINFKDAEGNDLATPLADDMYKTAEGKPWAGEIDPDKFSLELFPADADIPEERITTILTLSKFDDQHYMQPTNPDGTYGPEGDWYLNFRCIIQGGADILQDHLIYKFKCPTIFGDDSVHDITAYWNEGYLFDKLSCYPSCPKVVIDGVEYTVVEGRTYEAESSALYIGYFTEVVIDR